MTNSCPCANVRWLVGEEVEEEEEEEEEEEDSMGERRVLV